MNQEPETNQSALNTEKPTADQIINAILINPDFLQIRKEVIVLPGRPDPYISPRKILVMENCGLVQTRSGRIDREIKSDPLISEFIEPRDKYGAAALYVQLYGHSFGDVPSIMQYLAILPTDLRVWVDACMAISPEDFEWIKEGAAAIEKEELEALKALYGFEDQNGQKPEDKKKPKRPRQKKPTK